ncbi:YjbF family lipoprotein [Amylibacter sp.]|nr:YjbF family lipoprotein [Amylibacter sp.]
MKHLFYCIFLLLFFSGCDNKIDFKTPEIKILNQATDIFKQSSVNNEILEEKINITRKRIDNTSKRVLFFEKSSGFTGILELFPGPNLEETWFSSDGITVSLFNGELIATRGMGNDVMNTIIPRTKSYNERVNSPYLKTINFLTSENKIQNVSLNCVMTQSDDTKSIEIFERNYDVSKYVEICRNDKYSIENQLWQDLEGNTLKSVQWHSKTHGYISFIRLN